MLKTAKLASVMLVMGLATACSPDGTLSTRLQLTDTGAGHVFDKDRTSFGQRIALAEGGFTTRVHDLAPYVGR